MRVILTVHTFFPRSSAGTEVYTLALARRLRARGVEVTIITCDSNVAGALGRPLQRDDKWDGFPVLRLSFNVLHTPNPVLYDYENPWVAEHLKRLYNDIGANLVHVCHPGNLSTAVITAANWLQLPVVLTATDFWTFCPTSQLLRHDRVLCDGPSDPAHCLVCTVHQREHASAYRPLLDQMPHFLRRWGMWLTRFPVARYNRITWMAQALLERPERIRGALQGVDRIISPSHFLRDRLADNGIPAAKIMVSAHGIETDWLAADPQSERPAGPLRFAYIGHLAWHKGPHVAVEAFDQLADPREATLTLYGGVDQREPDYVERLQARIANNPLITYQGQFPRDELARVLAEADVLLTPSMWYENTPTIMYEAFATRSPVIATAEGGMAELIKEFDGGWTFPRGDAAALAAQLESLIDQPSQVEEARTRIKRVRTIDEHVVDVLKIYQQVGERVP